MLAQTLAHVDFLDALFEASNVRIDELRVLFAPVQEQVMTMREVRGSHG
jgi:hypothetical protein